MTQLETYHKRHDPQTVIAVVVAFALAAVMTFAIGFFIGRAPIAESNRQMAEAARSLKESNDKVVKMASERDGWRQIAIDEDLEHIELAQAVRSATFEAETLRADNVSLTAQLQKTSTPTRTTPPKRQLVSYAPPSGTYRILLTKYFGANAGAAYRVMMGESSGNPRATNGTCRGLFQIHQCHAAKFREVTGKSYDPGVFDAEANIRFAAYMSKCGADWSSWQVQP